MYQFTYIKRAISLFLLFVFCGTQCVFAGETSCLSPLFTDVAPDVIGASAGIDFDLMHLKDDSIKAALADPNVNELHVITAGGGGDVMGGTFLALQMQAMTGGKKFDKIKVFTSNLKRGHENPPGGPLQMEWMKTGDGDTIAPFFTPEKWNGHDNAPSFFKMENGLYVDVPVSDMAGKPIVGYNAQIPVSEEKIIDILSEYNIELVMSDVGQSGAQLASNYEAWMRKEGRFDNVFVVGLDMGGDILARFDGDMDAAGNELRVERDRQGNVVKSEIKTDENGEMCMHPESGVRSPNTDAVFLDMFGELQKELGDRIVVGVSAAGGDGELNKVLFDYIRDFYDSGDVVGALDNIGFLTSYDPKGEVYGKVLKFLLNEIPSEVSGNFLMRLLDVTRISPIMDPELRAKFTDKIDNWAKEYYELGVDRRASDEFVHAAEKMAQELTVLLDADKKPLPGSVSRRLIRNGSRTEWLPAAYPYTILMRPKSIISRIKDAELQDPTVTWGGKDVALRKKGFQTEKTDKNNVADRRRVNSILLKTMILENALRENVQSPQAYVEEEFQTLAQRGYELFPEVYQDLRAVYPMLSGDLSNVLIPVTRELCESERERRARGEDLLQWIDEKRSYVMKKNSVSFYMFADFCVNILPAAAKFAQRHSDGESIAFESYLEYLEYLFSFMETTVGGKLHSEFTEVFVDKLMPAIVQSSHSFEEMKYKCEYLKRYKRQHSRAIEYSPEMLNYVEVVTVNILSHHYADETQFYSVISEFEAMHARLQQMSMSANPHYVYNVVFAEMLPTLLQLVEKDPALDYSSFFHQMNALIDMVFTDQVHPNVQMIVMKYLSCVLSHHLVNPGEPGAVEYIVKDLNSFYSSVHHVSAAVTGAQVAGRDVSSVIRFALRLSESSKSYKELRVIEEKLLAGSLFLDLGEHFAQIEKYYGTQYVVPSHIVRDVYERLSAGENVLSAISSIDFHDSQWMGTGTDADQEAFDTLRASEEGHVRDVQEQLTKTPAGIQTFNQVDAQHTVEVLGDSAFVASADIKTTTYVRRGIELMRTSAVACGVTAGYLLTRPHSFMDIDSLVQLREGKIAQNLLEFKIEMLKLSQRVLKLAKRVPLVIMSGFTSDVVNEVDYIVKRTRYAEDDADVYTFQQSPTPILNENGLPTEGDSQYTTAGAWGFIRWMILSGTLEKLQKEGVQYITHSNVNNPVHDLDPYLIGYFDEQVKAKALADQPIALVEFVKRSKDEVGGIAVAVKEENGEVRHRILHSDRWGAAFSLNADADVRMNTANYILNIEKIASVFRLAEYADLDSEEARVRHIDAIEKEHGVKPVIRPIEYRNKEGAQKGVYADYLLDDISLLGDWVGVDVDRENHFIKLKTIEDIQNFSNKQKMMRVVRKRSLKAFIQRNVLLRYLGRKVFPSYANETVESLRKKVIRLVLPSRMYEEGNEWTPAIVDTDSYVPGFYKQWQVEGTAEESRNMKYRLKSIIEPEVALLCAAHGRDYEKTVAEVKKLVDLFLNFEVQDGRPLVKDITNAESNMVVRQCIKFVFSGTFNHEGLDPYQKFNTLANEIAVERLRSKGRQYGYEQLLTESISSVEIKFALQEQIRQGNLAVSFDDVYDDVVRRMDAANKASNIDDASINRFLDTIVNSGKKKVTYVVDDNGEIIYHLYLLQRLMRDNPELEVVLLPRGAQYGVDASYTDVVQWLYHPLFSDLQGLFAGGRFSIIESSPLLGGVDLKRLSREASRAIAESDCVFSVGCINYEMLNGIKKDSFHLLMVNGETAEHAALKKQGEYLLAYYPAAATQYLPSVETVFKKAPIFEIKEPERGFLIAA